MCSFLIRPKGPWSLVIRTTSHWWLLVLCGLFASTVSHAEGYFSASNLGGAAVLREYGDTPLEKVVARVEIYLEDFAIVLASGTFCKDGFFTLGVVYDPLPGTSRVITVHIWDASVGATFASALSQGHGFATVQAKLTLANEITLPPSLFDVAFRETVSLRARTKTQLI